MKYLCSLVIVGATLLTVSPIFAEPNLAELEQRALNDAANAVEDSVVQVRTIGGLDRVGKTLISDGPTTGLIVSADGYIVSSAFNFANQPSSILVRLADGKQLAAELVGRDKNRMLVLLKVNSDRALPVPTAVEPADIRVGQWAIALGRTFSGASTDVTVGIVSATNRKYGRAIQTDANVSVANYGGPLVDISGRVIGVLVPMSPQSSGGTETELAGAQYYDSGIGFAVPLSHVLSILERWKEQPDLLPGKLGIGMKNGDAHVTAPELTSIWPNSPAYEAGWQSGDLIVTVNDQAVATQAQLRFQIMPRYADDTLRVTLKRNDEQIETSVTLTGKLPPYRHAFLGILPNSSSDGDKSGAIAGVVWPESPAAQAGIQTGDRITKLGETKVTNSSELRTSLLASHPGQTVSIEVTRGDEQLQLKVKLVTMPQAILSPTDLADYRDDATQTDEQPEFKELKVPEFSQVSVYATPTLPAKQSAGLLLWLSDGDKQTNQALADQWLATCQRGGYSLMIAAPAEQGNWTSSDLDYLQQLVRLARLQLQVDPQRMVVVGQDKAGQLAYALSLGSRSPFAGVVSIDAPLPRTLTPGDTSPRNRLAVLAVESKDSNFGPLIRRDLATLREKGYPATSLTRRATGDDDRELEEVARASIERWIFGLDRL